MKKKGGQNRLNMYCLLNYSNFRHENGSDSCKMELNDRSLCFIDSFDGYPRVQSTVFLCLHFS